MFQTYEPVSDRSFGAQHVPLLRAHLKVKNLTGFIIPHDDEYQNEYIPAYAERLMWISGFSGSAGAAIVLLDKAAVFSDGRYTLQLRQQVDDQMFALLDTAHASLADWLQENTGADDRIGYDPMLHTKAGLASIKKIAATKGFTLVPVDANPIDAVWHDQPSAPHACVVVHDIAYAGRPSDEKRREIGANLRKLGADAVLLTAPPSIAWTFNIRGGDVARTPLPLARAIVRSDGAATLFLSPDKIDSIVSGHLGPSVDIRTETAVSDVLAELGLARKRIAVDPTLTPVKYMNDLKDAGAVVIETPDPCALPRATKNATEQAGARAAHIRDGAAVTNFLHWLATEAQSGDIDEIAAAKKLETFRRRDATLADISFDSISAAGPNGAICHYRVSTETNIKLTRGSLFLIDSGGQYPDGTTDITRTIPIGEATAEMRDRFTRVLKGHIALATLRFPRGTTGHQIDAVARKPLWDAGLDYDHGTGHGVGSFLGVHEGPQRIAKAPSLQALEPGMIVSNEPGYYKAGEYGIRIENLVIVAEPGPVEGGEREMLNFETITLAPISRDLILPALLTASEREWLNAYHTRVRAALTPLVSDDTAAWLENETRPI